MINKFNEGEVSSSDERKRRYIKKQSCINVINCSDSFVLIAKQGSGIKFEGYAIGDDMPSLLTAMEGILKQVKEKKDELC